jgi:hypothetical protein
MADDKKQENKIREGTGDDINDQRGRDKAAYPKLDTEDKQHKTQPEYIEKEPNKKDQDDE